MTYFINGKEVSCCYVWRDDTTFCFDIGDRDFKDSNGDDYFIHVEYWTDKDKFVFEIWWDNGYLNINECKEQFISEQEKETIKEVMYNLMKQ